jgi:hypothetical protein
MSSILLIKITTDGDYVIKKPIQFSPSMVKEKGFLIYFPPTIKLTKKLFDDILPENDIISILTSASLFASFLNKVIKTKDFKKITLKEAYEKGIVKDNMNFYKELFFNKRKIYLNGVAFTIRKSNIIDYSAPTTLPPTRYLNYEMVVNLSVIKTSRATRVNMMRENCKDKAKRIDDLSKELFGKSLGLYKEEDSDLSLRELLPAMYSSPETGFTTENIPRQQQYPPLYRLPYPPQQYPQQYLPRYPQQYPQRYPPRYPQQYGLPYPPQQYGLPYPSQQYPQYQIPYRTERERALLNRASRRGGKNKRQKNTNKKNIKTRKIKLRNV